MSLSLALVYENFGGVPAFSHAQLSLVGYARGWLWEEAALGTGGENICFDPLGALTRATITDVRPKLFDGDWKQNVGGGDFALLWDAAGRFQYLTSVDPQLHTSGPCLSNASYVSVTEDGAVSSRVEVSGARGDDLVRVFIRVRLDVTRDYTFSRLSFYTMGSETYNYYPNYGSYVFGSGETRENATHQRCKSLWTL